MLGLLKCAKLAQSKKPSPACQCFGIIIIKRNLILIVSGGKNENQEVRLKTIPKKTVSKLCRHSEFTFF